MAIMLGQQKGMQMVKYTPMRMRKPMWQYPLNVMLAPKLFVRKLDDKATLPKQMHAGDCGMDISSCEDVTINPGETKAVGTGLSVAFPKGYVLYLCPRSGLSIKHGITILNTPATIDAGFRGEVKAILHNHSSEPFHISVGDRIAQMELLPIAQPEVVLVDELPEAPDDRGTSDFGSTGVA